MKKLTTILLCILAVSCSKPTSQDALIISEHTDQAEVQALQEIMNDNGHSLTVLQCEDLTSEQLKGLKTVIYHRSDTCALSTEEIAMKDVLLPFAQKGGNILLSMNAVELLNAWGTEPQPLEVSYEDATDYGFGRPLGFHGYREHPIYEGLHGGAYVWKATYDHKSRTLGFSGDNLPKAEGAKVLGVNWAYIRYHENRKIVWETPMGKGRILAIGGHLYFSQKNLNRSTLLIFMDNVMDWLDSDRRFASKEKHWAYDTVAVEKTEFPRIKTTAKGGKAWEPEVSELAGIRKCNRDYYWNVSGQQIVAFGHEQGRIEEVWIHPIMAVRDISFGVKYKGSENVVWTDTKAAEMTRCPEYLERRHILDDGSKVREIINASPTEPVLTIDWRWDNPEIEEVYVAYTSNLRLMWPYSLNSTGTLYYASTQNGAVATVFDRARELNVITAFNREPEDVSEGMFDFRKRDIKTFGETPAKHKSVTFLYRFAGEPGELGFCLSGGENGLDYSAELIREYTGNSNKIYEESKAYYADFDRNFLTIQSSDPVFNRAYRWNQISLDKFFCNTPSIGKSLMAGFWSTTRGWNGGHEVSGRPGYTWYFGRDTEFSGLALADYGDYEKVREILKTFGNFQDPDGKVYHELTTSGSAHYDAADATPLYIVLAGHYLRKSGDTEFIRSQWENIKKALSFCRSTDTDGDGLIENTNVGHGWQECYQLHGAHTEVYLAAIWTQALLDCELMAGLFGENELAEQCRKEAEVCRGHLDNGFWNAETGCYNHGLMQDGSYQTEKCVLAHTPVFFNLTDKEKAVSTARHFSDKYFSTDWGVRMVGYDSPYFGIGGYTYGNIWPFHNGCAAAAEYNAGLRYQGFRHIYSILRLYDGWDYGNLPEVIAGDNLNFTGICPHQQWSSSMNLYPLYSGMLGLNADAIADKMEIAPAFPVDWSYAEVKNMRLGEKKVHLGYERTAEEYRYRLSAEQDTDLKFSAVLPLGTLVEGVSVDGKEAEYKVCNDVQNVCVCLDPMTFKGAKEIAVRYKGGIGALLNLPQVKLGMADEGLRINGESYDEATGTYRLNVAGKPGMTYEIGIWTKSEAVSVQNAENVGKDGDILTIRLAFPQSQERFTDAEISISTK